MKALAKAPRRKGRDGEVGTIWLSEARCEKGKRGRRPVPGLDEAVITSICPFPFSPSPFSLLHMESLPLTKLPEELFSLCVFAPWRESSCPYSP